MGAKWLNLAERRLAAFGDGHGRERTFVSAPCGGSTPSNSALQALQPKVLQGDLNCEQTLQVSWIPALSGYVSNHVSCAAAWFVHSNSSSSIFAALRSGVAKPSVNQP
jgi:hypothetical protein